ncbi:hypothetical protein FX983_06537 [Pseudomonas frederiksbergensis]|uniref:Uncharacterized protein n=1 Tax=Pseudomonas frederiksbergensis TaxID=104087 RepID=A0A6L5BW49_9PSED|nr:hypothetical protein FX983_06537 [Pseudomonas frederiksbergensis]
MGNLVGMAIQFGIRPVTVFKAHRNRIRPRSHLRFKHPMQGQTLRILDRRSVKGLQQLPTLCVRQAIELMQRCLRRVFQRGDQTLKRNLHVTADPLRIDPFHGLNYQTETLALVIHGQCQRIVGAFLTAQRLDALPGRDHLLSDFSRAMAIVEHGAEQRRRRDHAAATLGQCQRRVFVTEQAGQAHVRSFHRRTRALPAETDAQRQGVDEHSQRAVGALAALHPPQQHGAEHHFVATTDPPQHLGPGQMHHAGGANPELPGLGA